MPLGEDRFDNTEETPQDHTHRRPKRPHDTSGGGGDRRRRRKHDHTNNFGFDEFDSDNNSDFERSREQRRARPNTQRRPGNQSRPPRGPPPPPNNNQRTSNPQDNTDNSSSDSTESSSSESQSNQSHLPSEESEDDSSEQQEQSEAEEASTNDESDSGNQPRAPPNGTNAGNREDAFSNMEILETKKDFKAPHKNSNKMHSSFCFICSYMGLLAQTDLSREDQAILKQLKKCLKIMSSDNFSGHRDETTTIELLVEFWGLIQKNNSFFRTLGFWSRESITYHVRYRALSTERMLYTLAQHALSIEGLAYKQIVHQKTGLIDRDKQDVWAKSWKLVLQIIPRLPIKLN